MKTICQHLKLVSLFFFIILSFQNCKVYQAKTVTVEEAVQASDRVLINSIRNETYKFKVLQKEGENLFGIAKKNSSTAKKLAFQKPEDLGNSKNVKILIPNDIIKEIHLQNKTLSTIITIAIPLAVLVSTVAIIGASLNNIDYGNIQIPIGF